MKLWMKKRNSCQIFLVNNKESEMKWKKPCCNEEKWKFSMSFTLLCAIVSFLLHFRQYKYRLCANNKTKINWTKIIWTKIVKRKTSTPNNHTHPTPLFSTSSRGWQRKRHFCFDDGKHPPTNCAMLLICLRRPRMWKLIVCVSVCVWQVQMEQGKDLTRGSQKLLNCIDSKKKIGPDWASTNPNSF